MLTTADLAKIERLAELLRSGALSQDEFEQQKAKILAQDSVTIPARERRADGYHQPFQIKAEPDSPIEWMVKPINRYFDFNGRSSRKEFWMFALGQAIVYSVLFVVLSVLDHEVSMEAPLVLFGVLAMVLFALATAIPNIAVQVRRFHDQEVSGWFVLVNLIPYIGSFIVIVMMCLEGTKGTNRFGPDPLATEG